MSNEAGLEDLTLINELSVDLQPSLQLYMRCTFLLGDGDLKHPDFDFE